MSSIRLILPLLTNNAITGVLPDCLNRLSNLEILRLEKNKLTGSLPSNPGICTMTRMQDFIVQRNAFRGSLPACMGQWSNLSRLIVSNNRYVLWVLVMYGTELRQTM